MRQHAPIVSIVIAAYNRRDVLLRTLGQLAHCGLEPAEVEVFVVDNASTDGSADAVAHQFPSVQLIRSQTNRGSCAKNIALPSTQAKYVVFLDDDSYPLGDSLRRMIAHFEADASLGAAGFNVSLPDGSRECSAYPNVFIGCGVGFRRDALLQVGGLPADFFMQAEEYDLSLRLLNAGWAVRSFSDLHVAHLKTPNARVSTRTTRLDARNNMLLIARRFPQRWVTPFANDWVRRYAMIASVKGHRVSNARGLLEGAIGAADSAQRSPISEVAFEKFARVNQISVGMRTALRSWNAKRVLLIDLGKNMFPYWAAAQASGAQVVAIADRSLGGHGWSYRGIPILNDAQARALRFDAAVVSNLSPVHASNRLAQWRRLISDRPVVDFLEAERDVTTLANLPVWTIGRNAHAA